MERDLSEWERALVTSLAAAPGASVQDYSRVPAAPGLDWRLRVIAKAVFQATTSGAVVGAILAAVLAIATGVMADLWWIWVSPPIGGMLGIPTGAAVGLALVVRRRFGAGLLRLRLVAGSTAMVIVLLPVLLPGGTWTLRDALLLGVLVVTAGGVAYWRTPSILGIRSSVGLDHEPSGMAVGAELGEVPGGDAPRG